MSAELPVNNQVPIEDQSDSIIKKQWVSGVIAFSSQYNNTTWAADRIIGVPQVYPNYGDQQNAWGQSTFTKDEFIELEFPQELVVTKLNIYETFHCGAIIKIKLKNKNSWETIWEVERPDDIGESRIFSPYLKRVTFKTKYVRLELDCSRAGTWCELDAVEMEGKIPFNPDECELELANDLKKLLDSERFSDVKFEIDGNQIIAHRNILAARSEYFKNTLCSTDKHDINKPIEIDNIKYDVFKSLIFYFYTNSIEVSTDPKIVCELMRISALYKIDELKSTCIDHIEKILSVNNVVDYYRYSALVEPHLTDIIDLILKYISKHFTAIIETQTLKTLPQSALVTITQYYSKNRL